MASLSQELDAGYQPIMGFVRWSTGVRERSELVASTVAHFESLRDRAPDDTIRAAALGAVLDGAALETGAIEGLYPVSSGTTISIISGQIQLAAATGELRHIEDAGVLIRGQRDAYDLALDVVTSSRELSEALVRRIHETVCAGQEKYAVVTDIGIQQHGLPKGEYKAHPNHVALPDGTTHSYCPVGAVGQEMARLIDETRSSEFHATSPTLRAAYIHHSLTHIHPFSDGNGRTARVVASIPLLAAYSVPVVVFADRDGEYRATQADADRGDTQGFVSLLETSVVDVLNLMAQRIETDLKGRPDVVGLAGRLVNRDGGEIVRAGAIAQGLLAALALEVAAGFELPAPLEVRCRDVEGPDPTATRLGAVVQLLIETGNRKLKPLRSLAVLENIASDTGFTDANFPVRIEASTSGQQVVSRPVELRLDELLPRPSLSLRARLRSWLEGQVVDMLKELDAEL